MKFKCVFLLLILIVVFLSGCLNSSVLPQTKQISPEPAIGKPYVAPLSPEPAKENIRDAIVGKWQCQNADTIQFFKDGTCIVMQHNQTQYFNYFFVNDTTLRVFSGSTLRDVKISISRNELIFNNVRCSIVLPQTNSISPEPTFEVIQVAPTPEPSTDVNQRSPMSFTELSKAMSSNGLTTLQKENLYINKIFMWQGKIKDVSQDVVVIQFNECEGENCFPVTITLHVENNEKPKLNYLNIGNIMTFEGTFKSGAIYTLSINRKYLMHIELDMHNGKINN